MQTKASRWIGAAFTIAVVLAILFDAISPKVGAGLGAVIGIITLIRWHFDDRKKLL